MRASSVSARALRARGRRQRRATSSSRGDRQPRRRDHAAAPSTRGRSSRSIQSTIAWVDVPGVKMAATPMRLQRRGVLVGNDAAAEHDDVVGAARLQRVEHRREMRHVRPRHHRQPDRVDRLLLGRRRDHLGRLVQAAVDDLVTGVGQRARHDLGATVVPVEPSLRDQDAELAFHGRKSTSERRLRRDAAARLHGGDRAAARPLRRAAAAENCRTTPPSLPGRVGVDDQVVAARRQLREHVRAGRHPARRHAGELLARVAREQRALVVVEREVVVADLGPFAS